jgi:predicted RNA-binding protein with RPS1 domain
VDFGAFVVLDDGIEGLLHVTEMADGTLKEPYSYLKRGDRVSVRIVRIESDRKRIGFSQRGLELELPAGHPSPETLDEQPDEWFDPGEETPLEDPVLLAPPDPYDELASDATWEEGIGDSEEAASPEEETAADQEGASLEEEPGDGEEDASLEEEPDADEAEIAQDEDHDTDMDDDTSKEEASVDEDGDT